jgi:hypothetical protein
MDRDEDIPPELDEAINRIGVEALKVAADDDARVLIYGEISEDLDHMIFRHGPAGGSTLYCADDVPEVLDAVHDAWEICRARGEKYRWRAILYRIERRKIDVKLLYADEVDEELSMYDKEDRLLETYYPGVEIVPMAPDPPGSVRLQSPDRSPLWKFWR